MSEHDTAVAPSASPVEERTPAQPQSALSALGAAGNGAVARRIAAGGHPMGLSSAGNAAISRAIGGRGVTGGAAPEGFTDRLGSAEAGRPIPEGPRQSLESAFGTDLGAVRLHVGAQSSELATEVQAKAFTVDKDIYFGDGQYAPESASGYQLLAHEVTHTLQQVQATSATVSDPADASEREAEAVAASVAQHRAAAPVTGEAPGVMRDVSATDVIPDFILDGIKSAISAVPGYDLLAGIIGKDPITDRPVHMGRTELVEKLLTYGPFGANVGQVLQAVDVLGDVYTLVTDGLSQHNLTLTRIERDIGAAWDEISITNGIDGNAAIVRRYVDAILNDVSGFVRSIVDRVIEKVRAVVAEVAEPHLQSPQVKPVWDLARKVLHYDPLRGTDVNAPTVEILGDFLRLIGKEEVLAQMTERGTLQQAADWLDTQFATFAGIKNDLLQLFADAWAAISPQNLPNLLDTLPSLARRAFDLVQRIAAFAQTVIAKALELVKTSLLGWLSQHAHEMPGFRLLTVMIGQNPFTGDAVPRTAANLIGGFITLLPNGEATYQQLAESGVIDEAAGRIESAMTRLNITTELITGTFLGIWNSLTLEDLVAPLAAFERVLARFREPLGRILEFVAEVVKVVIELILKLMNFPSDLLGSIISNATAAIDDIQRDPVAFLLNMLTALKAGFVGFFDNILPFLLEGLTSWLFRGLGAIGITRPPDLSLESILGLALQVLGITAESLWQKVGEHIGPERMQRMRGAVDRLSGAWQFIKDVQEGGAAAIWRYVTDRLSSLWDTVLEMAKNWIMTEIVERVTARLISMLDPTGVMAVINSFVAFFNAVQSAIEYLRDILTIVNGYVTTFAQVAAGNIVPGAQKITQGLGQAVPIAIGFLANQVGIGNIPEKIVEIIGGLRELVDQAIDWLIQQAISLGQSAMNALGLGEQPGDAQAAPVDPNAVVIDEDFTSGGGEPHEVKSEPGSRELIVHSTPIPLSAIPDPTNTIQTLNTEYLAARSAYETALAQHASGARPSVPLGTLRTRLDDKVREIVNHLKTITLPVDRSVNPGASAPNIGFIARHGQQPTRIRTDSGIPVTGKIWQTESEHVIPFMASAQLWNELGLGALVRGGRQDDYQTTIVIYEQAARVKTPPDLDAIADARAEARRGRRDFLNSVEIESDFQQHGGVQSLYGSGPSSNLIEDTVDKVMQKLIPLRESAVQRTIDAIAAENQATEPGHPKKNAARRAPDGQEEPCVPGESAVRTAAERQYDDLRELLLSAFDDEWRGSI